MPPYFLIKTLLHSSPHFVTGIDFHRFCNIHPCEGLSAHFKSASKCCRNGFSLKCVPEKLVCKFTRGQSASQSAGISVSFYVRWILFWEESELKKEEAFLFYSFLSPNFFVRVSLPLPLLTCQSDALWCFRSRSVSPFFFIFYRLCASIHYFFSRIDFCSAESELLPAMTTAEELMTMTTDSKVASQSERLNKTAPDEVNLARKLLDPFFHLSNSVEAESASPRHTISAVFYW